MNVDDVVGNFLNMNFWGANLTPSDIAAAIIRWILFFVFVMAVVYLVWAGYTYITAGGDAEKATTGRQGLINAIIGIIIILLAWAIINYLLPGAPLRPS